MAIKFNYHWVLKWVKISMTLTLNCDVPGGKKKKKKCYCISFYFFQVCYLLLSGICEKCISDSMPAVLELCLSLPVASTHSNYQLFMFCEVLFLVLLDCNPRLWEVCFHRTINSGYLCEVDMISIHSLFTDITKCIPNHVCLFVCVFITGARLWMQACIQKQELWFQNVKSYTC